MSQEETQKKRCAQDVCRVHWTSGRFYTESAERIWYKGTGTPSGMVIDGVREEIIQNNIKFKPIWYKNKIDASSQKVRRIGIQNIKQQIYDYIAVEAMGDILKRIGEYQCAALKGRGQSYGIKAIKRWMRNKNIRYAGQCDIKSVIRQ